MSTLTLEQLNALTPADAHEQFLNCCTAERWVDGMVMGMPYASLEAMREHAKTIWAGMEEAELLQAYEGHPKIGDVSSQRKKYASTKTLASNEQSGANAADEAVLQRLAQGNADYENKFGFIFIVFATGKSAAEMLAILESRIGNTREQELQNAADNQMSITDLRLRKLLGAAPQ